MSYWDYYSMEEDETSTRFSIPMYLGTNTFGRQGNAANLTSSEANRSRETGIFIFVVLLSFIAVFLFIFYLLIRLCNCQRENGHKKSSFGMFFYYFF